MQGWWKGELKGRVGVFPDNFVELISSKNENDKDADVKHEPMSRASKVSHGVKMEKKANVRKSLDAKNMGK